MINLDDFIQYDGERQRSLKRNVLTLQKTGGVVFPTRVIREHYCEGGRLNVFYSEEKNLLLFEFTPNGNISVTIAGSSTAKFRPRQSSLRSAMNLFGLKRPEKSLSLEFNVLHQKNGRTFLSVDLGQLAGADHGQE